MSDGPAAVAASLSNQSQRSFSERDVASKRRDYGRVEEDWYLYRGTCTNGHWNIVPVRMAGLPGQDNDAKLGTIRTDNCSQCGRPVELRWDEEPSAL